MSDFVLSIPTISCQHCADSITAAVAQLGGQCTVDIAQKTAQVHTDKSSQELLGALDAIGFSGEVIKGL